MAEKFDKPGFWREKLTGWEYLGATNIWECPDGATIVGAYVGDDTRRWMTQDEYRRCFPDAAWPPSPPRADMVR